MQVKVAIKDRDQNITHTVTGIGNTEQDCAIDALKSLKKLLKTDNLEIKKIIKPKKGLQ
jgi:endonuclease YncB( thermonuclease family)